MGMSVGGFFDRGNTHRGSVRAVPARGRQGGLNHRVRSELGTVQETRHVLFQGQLSALRLGRTCREFVCVGHGAGCERAEGDDFHTLPLCLMRANVRRA